MEMTIDNYQQWKFDEWEFFNNNSHWKDIFNGLNKQEQNKIQSAKNTFYACYYSDTPNAISDGEDTAPRDSYEQFLEDTRKKQEDLIKSRGQSFVFYQSFIEALEDMDDKKFRECIMALCDYGLHRTKGEYKGVVKMFMTQAIPQLDANERKRLTAQLNGMKGGAPMGNQNAKKQ